jgi:hypothetical protein
MEIQYIGYIIGILALLYMIDRMNRFEQRLDLFSKDRPQEMEKKPRKISPKASVPPPSPPPSREAEVPLEPSVPPTVSHKKPAAMQKQTPSKKEPSELAIWLTDNWMGIAGAFAMIIGFAFFALSSDWIKLAETRLGLLFSTSLILFLLSRYLCDRKGYRQMSGWFQGISGGLILFAAYGAGQIEALRVIQSESLALSLLIFVIVLNVALVSLARYQAVASLHVALSLLVLSTASQAPYLIPVAAAVVLGSLLVKRSENWHGFHLISFLSYFLLALAWIHSYGYRLNLEQTLFLILPSLLLTVLGSWLQIQSIKKEEGFSSLLLASYLSLPLTQIIIYSLALLPDWWSIAPFALVSLVYLNNAVLAKKLDISFIFSASLIMAELFFCGAILSLYKKVIGNIDVTILIFVQLVIFNAFCQLYKQKSILRLGYFLQNFILLVSTLLLMGEVEKLQGASILPYYLRAIFILAVLSAKQFYSVSRSWISDSFNFIVDGKRNDSYSVSLSGAIILYVFLYTWQAPEYWMQAGTFLGLILLAYASWKSQALIFTRSFALSLFSLTFAFSNLLLSSEPSFALRPDLVGLLALNLACILLWRKTNLSHFFLYLTGFYTLCLSVEVEALYFKKELLFSTLTISLLALALLSSAKWAKWTYSSLTPSWWILLFSLCMVIGTDKLLYSIPSLLVQLSYAYFAFGDECKKCFKDPSFSVLLPIFLTQAFVVSQNITEYLSLAWIFLSFLFFGIALLACSKRSVHIAMLALAFCCLRLIFWDFTETDLSIRGLLFLAAGAILITNAFIYKRYKHRIK